MRLSLSLSLLWVHGGDLQAKFALERSIRVFTGRAPTKEPRRANFMKHGAVYRERTQILDSARISLSPFYLLLAELLLSIPSENMFERKC